ncbi:hypothetical protein HanXRQr2_Chr15g0709881 [Helianthus annuus]|uniref:Uncharacterized protein n=1 Tax=Helianthus annuus TaxID=4232 RepID=A0A251SB08_HELAN|nr:hypothetical protein HanXRQr2_Chr15g0709881 [Helianthus annuus]
MDQPSCVCLCLIHENHQMRFFFYSRFVHVLVKMGDDNVGVQVTLKYMEAIFG